MTAAVSFRDVDPLQAERELLGACIRDEYALAVALECLPICPFHDELLNRLFYVLAGLYERDLYDADRNEERLIRALTAWSVKRGRGDEDEGHWRDYLDELWTPWAHAPDYVESLVAALKTLHELEAADLAAHRALLEDTPFAPNQLLIDLLFAELAPVTVRLKNAGLKPARATTPEPAPPSVDWKDLRERLHR